VDQAFDTVDIDERTEVDDTGDDAFDVIADLQALEAGCMSSLTASFSEKISLLSLRLTSRILTRRSG
jgi:hypothetical protein